MFLQQYTGLDGAAKLSICLNPEYFSKNEVQIGTSGLFSFCSPSAMLLSMDEELLYETCRRRAAANRPYVTAREMHPGIATPTDLESAGRLVLLTCRSPRTRVAYEQAIREFFRWRGAQAPQPAFDRNTVLIWRRSLVEAKLAPASVNQRLTAIRKLAIEAYAASLINLREMEAIREIPWILHSYGHATGNWLTKAQAERLLATPSTSDLSGLRDRVILAMLIGCGLDRRELAGVTIGQFQRQERRCVLVDVQGKHGRTRTVPVPNWIRPYVDDWLAASGIKEGRLLRGFDRRTGAMFDSISEWSIRDIVRKYASASGFEATPKDLRRTFAKLAKSGGARLDQIQASLGHVFLESTARLTAELPREAAFTIKLRPSRQSEDSH
jgi:site-specific recombinase XerD